MGCRAAVTAGTPVPRGRWPCNVAKTNCDNVSVNINNAILRSVTSLKSLSQVSEVSEVSAVSRPDRVAGQAAVRPEPQLTPGRPRGARGRAGTPWKAAGGRGGSRGWCQ